MAPHYVDRNADAVGTVAGTYNITGSNDQFSIAIDGGSNQVFTLTHGGARTAAQIVADLSALTSATASVVTINSATFVRIRTTSASGPTSIILVNAPSNNANTVLGFVATTYTGGDNVAYLFSSDLTGTDKQGVASGVEDGLNLAGWITVSGHHSGTIVMQSSMTPNPQNLRLQIKITTANTNTVCISVQNTDGTKVGSNGSTNGGMLIPDTGKSFRVIANKYQAFILCPFSPDGSSRRQRNFVCFGAPHLPSHLQGVVYEAFWMNADSYADTSTNAETGCFRSVLGSRNNFGRIGNIQLCYNGNIWENGNNDTNDLGIPSLITLGQTHVINQGFDVCYRWHDGSAFLIDPIYSWGGTARTAEGQGMGILWDSFILTDKAPIDATMTVDSKTFWQITCTMDHTDQQFPTSTTAKGGLWVVVP